MALAYALMNRPDLCVYVNALQPHCQAPLVEHIRKLNAIFGWAQKHPLAIPYKWMTDAYQLLAHSDAGFRREEKDEVFIGRAT